MDCNRTTLNTLLSGLGKAIGISNLTLNDKGSCYFNYNNHFDFVIETVPNSDTFFLHASILPLPPGSSNCIHLYQKVLELNYLCLETHGATFAIDKRNNTIILCYWSRLKNMEMETFINTIIRFLKTADGWWEHFKDQDFSSFSSPGSATSNEIIEFLSSKMQA